jgi:methionine synthase II (cobalamin-independent)
MVCENHKIQRRIQMHIPTEPVGSLPRPAKLQAAIAAYDAGKITKDQLTQEQDAACLDSIKRMEATGSPIVSDGEQRVSSFATYPLADTLAGTGLAENLAGDGQYFAIFSDGHHRQLPRLTGGPFRYKTYAAEYVEKAKRMATKPIKQAVIAPSMLALLYPLDGEVKGYTREQFLSDLCDECEKDIRKAFKAGASRVDRLHRGTARMQERSKKSLDRSQDARQLHRTEQPGH